MTQPPMSAEEAIAYLLDEFHLGDQVYTVRSRACEKGDGFHGNSWDHPDVLKFQAALTALEGARR